MKQNINKEWYGCNSSIIDYNDDYMVVNYGCKDKGIITSYQVADGIQLSFLDFDTNMVMPSQTFNSDIISINHCKIGRYECEFPNAKVAYLPENGLGISGTKYLPDSFSFPLQRYYGLSVVVDKQALTESSLQLVNVISIDLDHIVENLKLEDSWYTCQTPPKLQHLFSQIYEAKGVEKKEYFTIKAIELLYHINQLAQNNGCDFKYFSKGQIQAVKRIRDYLITHLEGKEPLDYLVRKEHISMSMFQIIFGQIYGDTPYAYLKKYKMNLAANHLTANKDKIGEIAISLGYNNASKFSKAFQAVYGVLPKDYRKRK